MLGGASSAMLGSGGVARIGGAGGGGGAGRAAGAGTAAFGASAAGGADLVASSSAMIRRMEARISSIDGSCDFAGCVMRASSPVRSRPQAPIAARPLSWTHRVLDPQSLGPTDFDRRGDG